MSPPNNAGLAFKRKAAENYKAALQLLKIAPNAAANRAYYALYHSVIGEFEMKGIKPEIIDPLAKMAFDEAERRKWRHSVVIKNGTLAGLTAQECWVLKSLFELRVTSDYYVADVKAGTLEPLLKQAKSMLEGLGVKVG